MHDEPERTTPLGLARYACEFLEAALAADDKMGAKQGYEVVAPIPVMFLTGQSIELSLKAYLLHTGVPLRSLRYDYGHEIHRAMRKAKELRLLEHVKLSEEDVAAIKLLDPLYSTKQLQYISTGSKRFPAYGPLEKAALRLAHGVSAVVGWRPKGLPNAP